MSHNNAVSVRGLSKAYRLGQQELGRETVIGNVLSLFTSPLANFRKLYKLTHFEKNDTSEDVLWALKDLSLDIQQGDVVGIIGRNGAGKSTLLKIISRITEPTEGQVDVYGRIASLLEVGTGFHPELTGRENIFLNGAILGMRKHEIERKFDEIVAFSEMGPFIDTPVKRYSSGMYVRLAFSVAAHLEPEILAIDEVLAVGDLEFQKKCLGKMDEVSQIKGRTVIFVSHNMGTIAQLCNKVIYLKEGQVMAIGETNKIISQYLREAGGSSARVFTPENVNPNKEFYFKSIHILDHEGVENQQIDLRFPFTIKMVYCVPKSLKNVDISLRIHQASGAPVFTTMQAHQDPDSVIRTRQGSYELSVEIPGMFLMPGDYSVSIAAHEPHGPIFDYHPQTLIFNVTDTGTRLTSYKDFANQGAVILDLPWKEQQLES